MLLGHSSVTLPPRLTSSRATRAITKACEGPTESVETRYRFPAAAGEGNGAGASREARSRVVRGARGGAGGVLAAAAVDAERARRGRNRNKRERKEVAEEVVGVIVELLRRGEFI